MHASSAAGLAALASLSGCFGDPPPAPEVAPIEVVVGSRGTPSGPCLLNRDEVAAGVHDVTVIAERGPARVVLTDETGDVVLDVGAAPGSVGQVASVRLDEGHHVVRCRIEGGAAGEAALRVGPAG